MTPHEPRPRADVVHLPARVPILAALVARRVGLAACGRVPGQFEIIQNQVPTARLLDQRSTRAVYRGTGAARPLPGPERRPSAYLRVSAGQEQPARVDRRRPRQQPDRGEQLRGRHRPPSRRCRRRSNAVRALNARRARLPTTPCSTTACRGRPTSTRAAARLRPWWAPSRSSSRRACWHTGDVGVSATSMLVNIRVRVFGSTNTQDIESDPFDFPVYVCGGCLIANVQPCPYTSPPATRQQCNIAQDNSVDCCSLNGELVCPPLGGRAVSDRARSRSSSRARAVLARRARCTGRQQPESAAAARQATAARQRHGGRAATATVNVVIDCAPAAGLPRCPGTLDRRRRARRRSTGGTDFVDGTSVEVVVTEEGEHARSSTPGSW